MWAVAGGFLLTHYHQDTLFFTINQNHTPFLDHFMTALSAYGRGDCIAILLISLLLIKEFRTKFHLTLLGTFGVLISLPIYVLKQFFAEPRPLTVYGFSKVHTVPWLENFFENSFPSGHTIGGFGFFFLLSIILPKPWKPLSLLFFALALGVAISRPYLGQHFFADIYAGSLLGIVITSSIYLIVTFYFRKNHTP